MTFRIPLSYNAIDLNGFNNVLQNFQGDHHDRFSSLLSQNLEGITSGRYVHLVNSGTSALHLALASLRINQGDVVMVPTFTYVGSVAPILYAGAEPFFIDCQNTDWNVGPDDLEEAIKSCDRRGVRPKAFICVHNYGMPGQLPELADICRKYGMFLIEDAAEAMGSYYDGKHTGTFGDVAIFSFNNNKLFTSYGGGAIVSSDKDIINRTQYLANHARDLSKSNYEFSELGYNYRISPLSAAYGLSQWQHIPKAVEQRRSHFERYKLQLENISSFQTEGKKSRSNRWLSTFCFSKIEKEQIATLLYNNGIETRPLWKPMHLQPRFQRYGYFSHSDVSLRLFSSGICLPSSNDLSVEQTDEICRLILSS